MSSEPPEEPLSRSEYNILSPASPKPIHFPAPTNIPLLDMQTDVGFNQTEPHMSDPATRNIETRPDMWQDPDERPAEPALDAAAEASPYSTGVDAPANGGEGVDASGLLVKLENGAGGVLAEASASTTNAQPTPILDSASHEDDKAFPTTNNAADQPIDTPALLSGAGLPLESTNATASPDTFSAQTDAVKLDQPSTQSGNGVANIQSLLGSLATAPEANGTSIASDSLFKPNQAQIFSSELPNAPIAPGVEIGSSPLSASSLGVPPSGLPPRPPPQEQPLINPNYAHSQHIRDYHPHATNSAYHPQGPASGQGNVADPNSRNYVPPVGSPGDKPQPANGVPSSSVYSPTQAAAGGQGFGSYAATPASAQAPSTPGQGTFPFRYSQSGAGSGNGASRDAGRRPEDRPWDAEVQRKYDRFLDEERRYVAEGRWEQFPQGSRLFVGNLSSEKVTKRDIFHVFHTYGELAQISIKQAYGFAQFMRAEDCTHALEAEQATQIRDKKIHLEVSKPQKNRPQLQRRSRSPPDLRNRPGSSADRYNGARGGNNNRRDDYRPARRSPSPRGYRDRYDDRYRRRSPSPQGWGRQASGRYRSPMPRRDDGDDLPLPRREPADVPEVQIIVLDSLDRDFISWVERAFSSRNVRVDVLLLSPRLSEEAVIRRQIVEGVLAVVKLKRQNQNSGQIGLQIFDRSAGVNNVRFEEYDNLPPPTCVELVLREKSKVAASGRGGSGYPASAPPYGQPAPPPPQQPYGYPPQHQQQSGGYPLQPPSGYPPNYSYPQPPPPAAQQAPSSVPPHLQSLITSLDPQNLQSLLSAMNTPQSAGNTYGGAPPPNSAVQALQQNPQLAWQLQQQQQPPQQAATGAGQVNMQEILARLGNSGAGGGVGGR